MRDQLYITGKPSAEHVGGIDGSFGLAGVKLDKIKPGPFNTRDFFISEDK